MKGSNRVRLVVFDCDGTLVDSQHRIVLSMREAWRTHGLPEVGARAVRRVVGLPLVEAIAVLHPEGSGEEHRRLAATYRAAFAACRAGGVGEERLFPGVFEALAALEAAGFLLGIATGKSRRGLLATLGAHGLAERFATLQTGDDGPGKPNPHMLLAAMAETGTEPRDTVFVSDTVYDMQMAGNAGVAAIGAGWGYHEREELARAGASLVALSFAEVPRAVASLGIGG